MVNQEQNADAARQEAAQRIVRPTEPDKTEGKKIDPKARREEERRGNKRREPPSDGPRGKGKSSGRNIDFEA